MTSNQIPLHVHAVFCQLIYIYVYSTVATILTIFAHARNFYRAIANRALSLLGLLGEGVVTALKGHSSSGVHGPNLIYCQSHLFGSSFVRTAEYCNYTCRDTVNYYITMHYWRKIQNHCRAIYFMYFGRENADIP